MTDSRNMAIPSSTYVPVRIYPTTPWQIQIGSESFQICATHAHIGPVLDNVTISPPVKGIERNLEKDPSTAASRPSEVL